MNYNIIIRLLIVHIKQNKDLYKSFNFSYKTQKYKLEDILKKIIYVLKTGISWRSLNDPLMFSKNELKNKMNWNTVYKTYIKLNKNDIFKISYYDLLKKYLKKDKNKKLKIIITDTTFIPNKNGKDKIGYNKFYNKKKGTKISLITDKKGIPYNIKCYNGNMNDIKILIDQLKDTHNININDKKYILADKGYDSNKLCEYLKEYNYVPIIPQRNIIKDINKYRNYDKKEKKILGKRIIIENMFSKMKQFRRLNYRYDSKISSFIGFVYLAFFIILKNYMK